MITPKYPMVFKAVKDLKMYGKIPYHLVTCNGDPIKSCGGTFLEELGFSGYGRNEVLSWGYCGKGPEVLAVTILSIYAGIPYTDKLHPSNNRIATIHYLGFRSNQTFYLGDAWVKKHYKAFTKEVIAKLPDSWTMTEADIDEWVKKQEEKK